MESRKPSRFELRLPPELGDEIDRWRREQLDLPPRAEAARRLIELGLAMGRGSQIDVHFTDEGREGVLTGLGEIGNAVLGRQDLDQLFGFLERERAKYPHPLPRK
jgi:hypothetical protein